MRDSHFLNNKDKERSQTEDSGVKSVEQINKSKALSYPVYLTFLEELGRNLRIK